VNRLRMGLEAVEILSAYGLSWSYDMHLPSMGGSELITVLKSKPETAKIPIVIVTSRSGGFTAKRRRAQFTIFKDIDIEDQLGKALASCLNKTAGKLPGHSPQSRRRGRLASAEKSAAAKSFDNHFGVGCRRNHGRIVGGEQTRRGKKPAWPSWAAECSKR